MKDKPKRGTRPLTSLQIQRVGAAMAIADKDGVCSPEALAAVKVLFYTGARPSELAALRWRHVDLKGGGAGIKINGWLRVICLPREAVSVMKNLPRTDDDAGQVFADVRQISRAWNHVRRLAKLDGYPIRGIQLTWTKLAFSIKPVMSPEDIGILLGHPNPARAMFKQFPKEAMRAILAGSAKPPAESAE